MHHDRLYAQTLRQIRQPVFIHTRHLARITYSCRDAALPKPSQQLTNTLTGKPVTASHMISFLVEYRRNRTRCLTIATQLQYTIAKLGQTRQRLIRPQTLANHVSRYRPATPVDRDIDMFRYPFPRQLHTLNQQSHDGTLVAAGCRRAVPQTRQVPRQRVDPLAVRRTQLTRLAELYRARWQVETDLAYLKTILKMDVLHCKTESGIAKELLAFAIVYNLVRMVMLEAGRRQCIPADRISFLDALRWLSSASPGASLPRLIVNPSRKGRVEPRSLKRRAKKYPYMIRPRKILKQRLLQQRVAA